MSFDRERKPQTRRRAMASVLRACAVIAGKFAWGAFPSFGQAPAAPGDSPTFLRQAGNYSEEHPVIVIVIYKGQKETELTGDQIGDKLTGLFKRIHDAPAKYFITAGGDYTSIGYFVKGHLYGPYGLKQSLSAMTVAADAYDERVRGK